MASVASGLSSDHADPSRLPLYLPLISRLAKLPISPRYCHTARTDWVIRADPPVLFFPPPAHCVHAGGCDVVVRHRASTIHASIATSCGRTVGDSPGAVAPLLGSLPDVYLPSAGSTRAPLWGRIRARSPM